MTEGVCRGATLVTTSHAPRCGLSLLYLPTCPIYESPALFTLDGCSHFQTHPLPPPPGIISLPLHIDKYPLTSWVKHGCTAAGALWKPSSVKRGSWRGRSRHWAMLKSRRRNGGSWRRRWLRGAPWAHLGAAGKPRSPSPFPGPRAPLPAARLRPARRRVSSARAPPTGRGGRRPALPHRVPLGPGRGAVRGEFGRAWSEMQGKKARRSVYLFIYFSPQGKM